MPLFIIATPIGNPADISTRALHNLQNCTHVICEEPKQGKKILSQHQAGRKELYKLNEHSTEEEVKELAALCKEHAVALISDCGTPGFCDPGSKLVKEARKQKIKIETNPGASSLMCMLSLSSRRIDHFDFVGFLPANKTQRAKKIQELKKDTSKNIFLMETPYRLKAFLTELAESFPERNLLLGINLTSEQEQVFECLAKDLKKIALPDKAEPIVLIYSSKA